MEKNNINQSFELTHFVTFNVQNKYMTCMAVRFACVEI